MTDQVNAEVAEQHIRRIVGPTILMGDGSYFDFEDPWSSTMTIEDYAWALAGTNRFRSQTRSRLRGGERCFYNVAQHCFLLSHQMGLDGHSKADCFAGLMHESGEVPWGDFPGPAKALVPDFKAREKRDDAVISGLFGVVVRDPALIKRYDLRMLATEKRDLMPHGASDQWQITAGYEPFAIEISPWTGERAAAAFLAQFQALRT
jgi:hypothetical protein